MTGIGRIINQGLFERLHHKTILVLEIINNLGVQSFARLRRRILYRSCISVRRFQVFMRRMCFISTTTLIIVHRCTTSRIQTQTISMVINSTCRSIFSLRCRLTLGLRPGVSLGLFDWR